MVDLLDQGSVEISSAGHPPPVLVSKGGSEQINCTGALPGFSLDADYESHVLSLSQSERLICFTDGLDPIGLSAGEPLPDWLANSFVSALNQPMDAAMGVYVDAVQEAVGPEPDDDWTLIAFERG